ncbi:hypothetical protein ABMA28_013863 [Loxostege sticticalis]|uniref:Uncharacterized protein n=1 Tax=Loxostege sticticalis TaxID=481309 RepID=A0ABD0TJX8_LOXSC
MLKVLLFLVVCCVAAVWSAPKAPYDLNLADQLFEEFVVKHNKQYEHEEERQMRFNIFKDNLNLINQRNRNSKTATYGINRFTDMRLEEVLQKHTCLNYKSVTDDSCPPADFSPGSDPVPESFDWRDKKKVTGIKDQGQCGSCWAFSATGNLEGQYAIKHNELKAFSEQQLVDCDRNDHGCDGGLMGQAFNWLQDNGGIESESDYPYKAKDGKCKFDKSKVVATVSGCVAFNGTDENVLKKILVSTGPLAIGVNANDFITYDGGVLEDCQGGNLNHGVLLVGYGKEDDVPYWIIKNSWGTGWGEDGYVRVQMYQNGCNLTADIVSAIVN